MPGFLQTANTNWNSVLERWLPHFAWRPVRGGLCGNEEFEKALAEIQHDTHHNGAGFLWIEILVQGEVRRNNAGRRAAGRLRNNAGRRAAGRLPRRPGRYARGRVPPGLDRWDIVLRRASKPCVCSRRAPDSAGDLRRQCAKIRRRRKTQMNAGLGVAGWPDGACRECTRRAAAAAQAGAWAWRVGRRPTRQWPGGVCRDCTRRAAAAVLEESPSSHCSSRPVGRRRAAAAPGGQPPFESWRQKFCYCGDSNYWTQLEF